MSDSQYETVSEALEVFEEMLNESVPHVIIAGIRFAPSDILRELDPIAFRYEFYDWLDAEGVDSDDLEDDEEI